MCGLVNEFTCICMDVNLTYWQIIIYCNLFTAKKKKNQTQLIVSKEGFWESNFLKLMYYLDWVFRKFWLILAKYQRALGDCSTFEFTLMHWQLVTGHIVKKKIAYLLKMNCVVGKYVLRGTFKCSSRGTTRHHGNQAENESKNMVALYWQQCRRNVQEMLCLSNCWRTFTTVTFVGKCAQYIHGKQQLLVWIGNVVR